MDAKERIKKGNLPEHIAIIMDGNGRWAQKRGNPRIFGHKNGVKAVRSVVEGAGEVGVKYLTLYAFSTENWNRPKKEIEALMSLLVGSIHSEADELMKNQVRLLCIGDVTGLPENVRENLQGLIDKTKDNQGLSLVLALNYSSKQEMGHALKSMIKDLKNGLIKEEDVDCQLIDRYLYTRDIPNPDLLIRTSGEFRISNFLLWQIAYAELYFTDILWPDFRKEHLFEAIIDYQNRERRFGKTSEQLKKKK